MRAYQLARAVGIGKHYDRRFFGERTYERGFFAVFEDPEAVCGDHLCIDDRGELLAVVFSLNYHRVGYDELFFIHFLIPKYNITAMPSIIL